MLQQISNQANAFLDPLINTFRALILLFVVVTGVVSGFLAWTYSPCRRVHSPTPPDVEKEDVMEEDEITKPLKYCRLKFLLWFHSAAVWLFLIIVVSLFLAVYSVKIHSVSEDGGAIKIQNGRVQPCFVLLFLVAGSLTLALVCNSWGRNYNPLQVLICCCMCLTCSKKLVHGENYDDDNDGHELKRKGYDDELSDTD